MKTGLATLETSSMRRFRGSQRETMTMDAITEADVANHGLTAQEYRRILEILERTPNFTELGIFSVMWSEHCSYKSSKTWLSKLPTKAPWVLCGPGENAGVVDIGDGLALVFKMESHNHPSFIEPFQGAATGVGGILRDVFTMGARPIANLNSLRFGDPKHSRTRHLVSGVVAGIASYGNCVGVPTVAGECTFHAAYNGNILVNAMTVGLANTERLFFSAAAGHGSPVFYVGSKTGRDGIHGATMASAEFTAESEEKRPTVQIGDPFTEKLLIEACLELMQTDAIVAIQDMGAAGLTSSSFEMASKGGVGVELNLDRVPTRETGMTAYEIMLSESQERMLMVLRADREEVARAIFAKWDLECANIGHLTSTGRMILRHHSEVVADVPIAPLADAAPEYQRPFVEPPVPEALDLSLLRGCSDPMHALMQLLGCPDLASKRWIWEQYDHMVMANTLQRPGADAAVVRVGDLSKAVAVACDCSPRYCLADPREGGRQAVAETWRNLCAVGAKPLAITDCLNFGNPEKPEIMGQFAYCIEGMADACSTLACPVVSGNVSLYNETEGHSILPTPTIGGIGVIDDVERIATIALSEKDTFLALVGTSLEAHWLGQSLYLRECEGFEIGAPPPVNLKGELQAGNFVRLLITKGIVRTCHDISDGGLLIAVAEMALAGATGVHLSGLTTASDDPVVIAAKLFGEDQGRYLIGLHANHVDDVMRDSEAENIPVHIIGRIGGSQLTLDERWTISLSTLAEIHDSWMPSYMRDCAMG